MANVPTSIGRLGTCQMFGTSTTSASSAAFGPQTYALLIVASVATNIVIDTGTPTEGQAGYRAGYVDPLIEAAQGGAHGVNKARPLTSDAFRDEAAVMAPGNDLMQRRLGREGVMFHTRQEALGGSKTADNLADADAMRVDPVAAMSAIGAAVHGNVHGVLSAIKHSGVGQLFTGNTPLVRAQVARYLLANGATLAPGQLEAAISATIRRMQRTAQIANVLGMASRSAAVTAQNELRNQK